VADAIFGSWTHRRADAGGSRALGALLGKVKPRVAWTWEPPAGARIDQVRTSGGYVYAAAMGSSEPGVSGWTHATLFAIDASNGRLSARRSLPDPVPVAALVLEGRHVHVVGTRPGEPVFWYALTAPDLRPLQRVAVPIKDARDVDVLDAWALSDGALWLQIETGDGLGGYVYAATPSAQASDVLAARRAPFRAGAAEGILPIARDACESGRSLFVPSDEEGGAPRDALVKLEPDRPGVAERRARPRRAMWGRVDPELDGCRTHALAAEGLVFAAAFGVVGREMMAQVIALDRTSGVERWKTPATRFPSSEAGSATRLAHVNGEVVMQKLSADGMPCSDLLFAGARGSFETATLGARRRFVLDASLGGSLLAHSTKADGSVLVAGFSAEGHGGILGRRVRMEFSVETPDVGGAPAVYAGAGKILVKGARRLVAIAV
jgi:hypothetical protein